jgi:hypothetical protein
VPHNSFRREGSAFFSDEIMRRKLLGEKPAYHIIPAEEDERFLLKIY